MTRRPSENFMRLALDLASKGRGRVEPNPMVGCVIVKDGNVAGRGWHEFYGGPHAEVNALADAGAAAEGADVFVTLEPCAHFGKTPPCTDALIRAKVRRVIMAMADPFPQTSGVGPRRLSEAGIAVETGLLEQEARELNAPYLKMIERKQSYLIAKWAMSLDGKIATRTGDSQWISAEESRRIVHQWRSEVDAVMVGLGTLLHDDPELTCRIDGGRSPRRIVVDTHAATPLASRIVATARQVETIIAAADDAPPERVGALQDAGCTVIPLPSSSGRIAMADLLTAAAERRITNIMVEGGGGLLASIFEQRAADEVRVFVAPVFIGGESAPTPLEGCGADCIAQCLRLRTMHSRRIGTDVLIEGRL